MKLSVTYEPREDYLQVSIAGEYDFLSAISIFHDILKEAWKQNARNILCDITKMTGFDFSPKESLARFTIARYVGTTLPKDIRLAILETPKQSDLFGETILTNKGARVRITTNKTIVYNWLGVKARDHAYS